MNWLEYAQQLLPTQGFRARIADKRSDWLLFEDAAVAGVIIQYPTVSALLEGWDKAQSAYLSSNHARLGEASYKAWNLYTVLLTSDDNPLLNGMALALEENFVSTRKLVGVGIADQSDLLRLLLPLLPLQNLVFAKEDDAKTILAERLTLPIDVIGQLLSGCSADDLAKMLKERP